MQSTQAVNTDEFSELQRLLSAILAPYTPLDISALDGYLVGVLLQQPRPLPAQWMRWILDEQGRLDVAKSRHTQRLTQLIEKRHAQLQQSIDARQWFDPWILTSDKPESPRLSVLPWVLGFTTACEHFPELTDKNTPELNEALAGIYQHLDISDLEDANDLIAEIETLEYPPNLTEAVEQLVASTLLLADISHPLAP
jgi:uncharacterized protein